MRLQHLIFLWGLFGLTSLMGQTSPSLTATGDRWYCVGTQQPIVETFEMEQGTDPIFVISIQITEGYEKGADRLSLIGEHPKFRTQWNLNEAKLSLLRQAGSTVSDAEYEQLIKDVVFETTNPNPSGNRVFAITVGLANYLPATGHYYEFVSETNVLWTEAKEKAAQRTHFGLQGYLATITLPEEATLIGELSPGTGWIGATDRDEEGVWLWDTGPEAGEVFWDNGNRVGYSFWNTGEPNNQGGDEHYAHVTADSVGILGSWNDLQNETATSGPYQAKGYMVEYGGMPGEPDLDMSTSSRMRMPEILSTTLFKACVGVPVVLTAAGNTDEDIRWYDQEIGGTALYVGNVFQPNISSTTTYWVEAPTGTCSQGPRVAVEATIYQPPTLNQPQIVLEQCDADGSNDGIAQYNLRAFEEVISENFTQQIFRYFTSPQKTPESEILQPTNFQNQAFEQTIFVDVQNSFGCGSPAEIVLKVGASTIANDFRQTYSICESSSPTLVPGMEQWDASPFQNMVDLLVASDIKYQNQNISLELYRNEEDAYIQRNPINYTIPNFSFQMDQAYRQEIWARVDNLSLNEVECLGVSSIGVLQVNPLPRFTRTDLTEVICTNVGPELIQLSATDSRTYQYRWFRNGEEIQGTNPFDSSQILLYQGGDYTVLAREENDLNCEARIEFSIQESEPATLSLEDLTIDDLNADSNRVSIDPSSLGDNNYAFAIDAPGGPFQEELLFEDVLQGIHRLYINDTSGCGDIFVEFSVLGIETFFTPNQDGFNDYWNVLGINENFNPNTKIFIFDRHGVLMHELDPLGQGWDGTYNGRPLPADDYWFRIYFQDGRIKQGHFSLIRI